MSTPSAKTSDMQTQVAKSGPDQHGKQGWKTPDFSVLDVPQNTFGDPSPRDEGPTLSTSF